MTDKQHDLRKECNASLLPHDGAIDIKICIGRLYIVSGPWEYYIAHKFVLAMMSL